MGLNEIHGDSTSDNKNQLIAQFPQWKPILENPESQIAQLIQENDFQTLRSIADSINNDETIAIIAKQLGAKYADSGTRNEVRKLVRAIIKNGDQKWLRLLANSAFSQPSSAPWSQELKDLVKKGNESTFLALAYMVFSKEHSKEWKEELILMIRKVDGSILFTYMIDQKKVEFSSLKSVRTHQVEIL